jgi:hypothetical protein
MGEKMGPGTFAAYHAGADHMIEVMSGEPLPTAAAEEVSVDTNEPVGEDTLQTLREARLRELKEAKAKARFGGGLKMIEHGDWKREVVEMSASNGGTLVVVHLERDDNPLCGAVTPALDVLARQRAEASFVSIQAEHCMPAEHFHLLPAVFFYCHGKLQNRLISKELHDFSTSGSPTPSDLEEAFLQLGVFNLGQGKRESGALGFDFGDPDYDPSHQSPQLPSSLSSVGPRGAAASDDEEKSTDNEGDSGEEASLGVD